MSKYLLTNSKFKISFEKQKVYYNNVINLAAYLYHTIYIYFEMKSKKVDYEKKISFHGKLLYQYWYNDIL